MIITDSHPIFNLFISDPAIIEMYTQTNTWLYCYSLHCDRKCIILDVIVFVSCIKINSH